MKNILILDDDFYKAEDARRCIEKIFNNKGEEVKTKHVSCFKEFVAEEREIDKYDLLILDMNFPVYPNERVTAGMGNSVINRLDFRNKDIKIIVFTSEPNLVRETSENLLGIVEHDSSVWSLPKFEDVLLGYTK